MDAKQRKTLMIRLGAGAVIVLVLLLAAWFFLWPSSETGPQQRQLSPSDPMNPAEVKRDDSGNVVSEKAGTLTVNPTSVQFRQDEPGTIVLTLTAVGGPVTIQGAVIPTTDADALKVANIDCPVGSAGALPANQTCTASVTWDGARSVNSVLNIATGTAPPTSAAVPAAATPTDAANPYATPSTQAAPAAAPQPSGPVVSLPITAVSTKPRPAAGGQVPPPAEGQPSTAASAPQQASGPSPIQAAREAYLAARRGQGFSINPNGLQASARSPYTSWDNIGVSAFKSSFPTDMTRVITPDKPLTAVLTYQIDTRQTVTAVATVDRDVYGSSGRTVVIPRGTKIIGSVGGGSTDRVGVAWRQLIRPDGVRFVFEGSSGDAMGRGGVPGRINNRYLQRYGFSLLPTLTAAGITAGLGGQSSTAANGGGTTQTQDARAVAAQILQQPLQQISQDLYQKNSNIPVQITIPAGTRITVWSTGDLRLKPVGEADADRSQSQQGPGSNQNGSYATGSTGTRGGQGFNPYAQQQTYAPAPQTGQQPATSSVEDRDDASSLEVGRVDGRGNYIAPGSTGPAPGPLVTGTNNAAQRSQQGGSFPASSNPWK